MRKSNPIKTMVIEALNKYRENQPVGYALNEDTADRLEQLCEIFDDTTTAERKDPMFHVVSNAEFVGDPMFQTATVDFDTKDMVIYSENLRWISALLERADKLTISHKDNDTIHLRFEVSGLWNSLTVQKELSEAKE